MADQTKLNNFRPRKKKKTELNNFIQSMHDKGILDEHFDEIKSLQSEEDPCYVSETIATFFREADDFIQEITELLDEHVISYIRVAYTAYQLKDCSTRIGGCLVAHHTNDVREASKVKDKERCIAAFGKVKEEYNILKESLTHISELEKKKY